MVLTELNISFSAAKWYINIAHLYIIRQPKLLLYLHSHLLTNQYLL